jgi:predicted AAA+ superfamily ATPase
VLNNALMTASTGDIGEKAINDKRLRGRLVESAVGAHLANEALAGAFELFYWRDGDLEVDFILRTHGRLTAIEVKSGNTEDGAHRGTEAFRTQFHPQRCILVGSGGIALEEFLSQPAGTWLNS